MHHTEHYEKDFILFLECGFIAISQLDDASAQALFDAAKLLQPNNPLLLIADGYRHFTKMQLDAAAKCFEAVLKKEPHNEMAQTFLGLTLSLTPKTLAKGEKILSEVGSHSHDPAVKQLASDSIHFVDTHLKKPSSIYNTGK